MWNCLQRRLNFCCSCSKYPAWKLGKDLAACLTRTTQQPSLFAVAVRNSGDARLLRSSNDYFIRIHRYGQAFLILTLLYPLPLNASEDQVTSSALSILILQSVCGCSKAFNEKSNFKERKIQRSLISPPKADVELL